MADLPSYAQPTTASESRRKSNVQDTKVRTNSYEDRKSQRMLVNQSPSRVLHRYSFSTASWRSKARWPGPFKLLELPPELRNRIYEYLTFDEASYYINLYHIKPGRIIASLPPLLAANRQLCDEVGGYYFSTGLLVFTINGYRIDAFRNWLNTIGPKNCQRLVENMNVFIRLFIPLTTFHCDERIMPYRAGVCVRGHLLSDLTWLVGLGSQFDELIRRYPVVVGWHVETYVTSSPPPQIHNFSIPRETWFPTPISHFGRLRPFLSQLLELFGGTLAETQAAQRKVIRDGPIWVARNKRKGVGTVRLPSGLRIGIDSRA